MRRWLKKLRAKPTEVKLPPLSEAEFKDLMTDLAKPAVRPVHNIKVTSPLSEMFGVHIPVRVIQPAYGKLLTDKQLVVRVLTNKLRSY